MSSALQASVFLRNNYSDTWHSIKNTEDLTMKQMFDIINWEDSSWKQLPFGWWWTSHQSLAQRFTYFQIVYYVLERWTRTHNQILHGKTDCANTTLHKTIFAAWISTRNSRTGQKLNKFGALTASEFVTQSDRPNKMCNELKHWGNPRVHLMTRERCGLNHSWACLFLSSFVFVVSVIVPWLFLQMYAHCIGSRADKAQVQNHPTLHAHVSSRCESCSWSLRLLHSLHLFPHHLSDHLAVPTARHLQLPGCGGQTPCTLPLRTLAPWPRITPPQVMSPTTTSSQRLLSNTPRSPQASSGSLMTSTAITSPSARRSLMRAEDEPITLKEKVCRPVCRRQSVMIERWDPLFAHLCRAPKNLRDTPLKVNRLGLSWSDRESRFSLTVNQRFKKHEFQADYDRKSILKLSETIESQKEDMCRAHQGDGRRRQDYQLFHEQLLKQNWNLREAHENSLSVMKQLKRFQGSTFETIKSRKLIEDRDTILELTGKIQELQNEINLYERFERFSRCWISPQWTFPRCQSTSVFPTSSSSWWNAKPFSGNAEPQKWAAKHLGHAWFFGKRFCKSSSVFLSTLYQRNRILGVLKNQNKFTHHRRWTVRTEHQFRIRDASKDRLPKIQSSLAREILSKIMGQTNNDCRSQIFISTNYPRQQRSLVGR